MPTVPDRSVHLVVTSPPYPMIPQWDHLWKELGATEYAGMHDVLELAWAECRRVLVDGGLLAVVIGDALRSDRSGFALWPNHAETLVRVARQGLRPLPYILWKKPTNKPNAFLGSGFLPPNAYVTLDCEYILLFRNGRLRRFPPHDPARSASRFTRDERDHWFSQVWEDVRGAPQRRGSGRSGAFPAEIPRRLIRMFSVIGDTVLDPFAGTGTTVRTAWELGRSAVGVEIDRAVYDDLVRTSWRLGPSPGRADGVRGPARRSGAGRSPGSAAVRSGA